MLSSKTLQATKLCRFPAQNTSHAARVPVSSCIKIHVHVNDQTDVQVAYVAGHVLSHGL